MSLARDMFLKSVKEFVFDTASGTLTTQATALRGFTTGLRTHFFYKNIFKRIYLKFAKSVVSHKIVHYYLHPHFYLFVFSHVLFQQQSLADVL